MEIPIGIESLGIGIVALVIALGDGRALEQHLVVFTDFHLHAVNGPSHRTDGTRLVLAVARHRSQTLREAVARYHPDTHREHKLLYLGRHCRSCCGEDIGMVEAYLLTHHAQDGTVYQLILQGQGQRGALAADQAVYIVAFAHGQRMGKEALFHRTRPFYLVFHGHIHLFPETGNRRHTRGMGLTHRLLYLLRIGIDDELGTHRHTQIRPTTLEDMGEGQEVDDPVVFAHIHAFAVGHKRCTILSIGQHHALALARSAAGVKDVTHILVVGLAPEHFQLALAGQILAQGHELGEMHGVGIGRSDMHAVVEDDDTLQRGAEREYTLRFLILFLLSHEEQAYLRIVDHKLYLLLTIGSVEGYRHSTHAVRTEISIKILDAVLREHRDTLLRLDAQIEQGIAHLFHAQGEMVP